MFVAFATGFARYGLVIWIPLYFVENFNINYALNGTAWAFATNLHGYVFSATAAGILNLYACMGAAI